MAACGVGVVAHALLEHLQRGRAAGVRHHDPLAARAIQRDRLAALREEVDRGRAAQRGYQRKRFCLAWSCAFFGKYQVRN